MLPAKFGSIWPSCFRGEDFFNISQSKKKINLGSHVFWPNGTKWRSSIEDLTYMLPAKFGSIWPNSFRGEDFFNISQSETRIALGGHICWRNGMKWRNFRGPYIDAFCQVWFHLAQLFHQSRLKYEKVIGRTTDAKWWQYLTWPFGSGELKRKKSRRGRRTTIRKKEMHPEIKESLKLSDKGSLLKMILFSIFFIISKFE